MTKKGVSINALIILMLVITILGLSMMFSLENTAETSSQKECIGCVCDEIKESIYTGYLLCHRSTGSSGREFTLSESELRTLQESYEDDCDMGFVFNFKKITNETCIKSHLLNECEKGNEDYMWKNSTETETYSAVYSVPVNSPFNDFESICKQSGNGKAVGNIIMKETIIDISNSAIDVYTIPCVKSTTFINCTKKIIEDLTCEELDKEFNCWGNWVCDNIIKSCDKDCDLYWMIKKGC